MSLNETKVLLRLRHIQKCRAALQLVIDDQELPAPTLFHSTLLALTAKEGTLQAEADQLRQQEERVAV